MSQSANRSLLILIELGQGERSLDQLADEIGVHKSTVLRLLRTLEEQGFVRHDSAHRYRLGPRIFDLAHLAAEQRDVRSMAEPHLKTLSSACGQTVRLAALSGDDVVYVDRFDCRGDVRMYAVAGTSAPLHATAAAKVLVAALPETDRRRLAAGLTYTRFTATTITSPSRFLHELEQVRTHGFAVERAEHEPFVNAIAVPIRDRAGRVVAAASISVPVTRLPFEGVLSLRAQLTRHADAVSAEYGWVGRSQPVKGRLAQ